MFTSLKWIIGAINQSQSKLVKAKTMLFTFLILVFGCIFNANICESNIDFNKNLSGNPLNYLFPNPKTSCPGEDLPCSGLGQCDYTTGLCDCNFGFGGTHCIGNTWLTFMVFCFVLTWSYIFSEKTCPAECNGFSASGCINECPPTFYPYPPDCAEGYGCEFVPPCSYECVKTPSKYSLGFSAGLSHPGKSREILGRSQTGRDRT